MKTFASIIIIPVLFALSCTSSSYMTSQPIAVGTTESIGQISATPSNLDLADYLRRIPGVQVSGSKHNPIIRIRSSMSLYGNYEPLYIIDRIPVGNNYSDVVSAIDANDIKRITVLKDAASSSMYGMQGANGVIIITTVD